MCVRVHDGGVCLSTRQLSPESDTSAVGDIHIHGKHASRGKACNQVPHIKCPPPPNGKSKVEFIPIGEVHIYLYCHCWVFLVLFLLLLPNLLFQISL